MATTLVLARHGETDWNRSRRWQGQADPPLNDLGREQSRNLATELAGEQFDALYSSDLVRARETAEIVGETLGLGVRLDSRLREIDIGDWSGLSLAETLEPSTRPLDYALAVRPDAFDEMKQRVLAAFFDIAGAHPDGRVLLVTHGGPIAVSWLAGGGTLENRPSVGNCHVRRIRVEDGAITGID